MTTIIMYTWIHFLGDFVLQSNRMALNKSKSIFFLTLHVIVYTLVLLSVSFNLKFALVNGVLHWVVDFITSKLTTYFYKKEERHLFFVVIGFDQAVHMTCLVLTIGAWL